LQLQLLSPLPVLLLSSRRDLLLQLLSPLLALLLSSRRDLLILDSPKTLVISTEATHSLIVSRAVERPPHFAVAVAVAIACPFVVIP
jgi:hypothetical protein